jgi:benzoyl-CoA-dihydrodiol lyase
VAAFRALDDALLDLRFNHLDVGLILLRTEGSLDAVLAHDAALHTLAATDWLAREVVLLQKRVLKRLDLTARSVFALVEKGSCFGGPCP